MCGIFGYIGIETDAPKKILDALKTLEYRGYDSWGIAVITDLGIEIEKKVGKIGDAQTSLPESTIGIGHTRWATHGGVTQENAHPHLDGKKRIAVVHNGIVENYHELKSSLREKGHEFLSETDSEVIAHVIQDHLENDSVIVTAVMKTFRQLVGSNALCVLDLQSESITVCRDGSPVVVGLSDDARFVASDVTPFLEYTKKVIFLDDGECAHISRNVNAIYDISSGKKKEPRIEILDWKLEDAQKDGYPHFLIKEIHEQIHTIPKTATLNAETIQLVAEKIQVGMKVVITACGTASFCGFTAQYYFSQFGIQAEVYGAYEIEPFMNFIDEKTILIAISQSGETADTIIAAKAAKKRGAYVVGVINSRGTTLERLADTSLLVGTGPEIAVVSTKAYTAQLATLYQLAYACAGKYEIAQENVKNLQKSVEKLLTTQYLDKVQEVAKSLLLSNHIFLIGKHIQRTAAMECALKIKEVSYIHAESFAAGELKHGVIALIEKGSPCIVLSSDSKIHAELQSSSAELKARGGYIIGIGSQNAEEYDVYLQTDEVGDLSSLLNVIVGQLLGYYTALGKGTDPDKPRNLAKSVTVK